MSSHLEYGIRDLRNHTRQVIDQVESGRVVYLTSHGRRIAVITPYLNDDVTQLLAMADSLPPADSGAHEELLASRTIDAELDAVRESSLWD